MALQPTPLQPLFILPTPIHTPPGNLQRFLDVSTPLLMTSFDRRGIERSPTVAQLFSGISKVSAVGLRFEFYDIDSEGRDEEREMLVYTPTLSLFKLRGKSTRLPKVQFETSGESIYGQLTPSAVMRTKINAETLSLLERTELTEVDATRSYFALKWQFQMSLTSKLGSKRHRHPNFLVYYNFQIDREQTWTRQLKVIGMKASTFGGLQRWTGINIDYNAIMVNPTIMLTLQKDQEVYNRLSDSLKELVQVTVERETSKYLLRKQYGGDRRESESN